MITLFGATGYTGRKIAAVLVREGLPFRIAGRSAARLEEMAHALNPGDPPKIVLADVARPGTLLGLVQNTRVLINCAGPYTDLGERVLAQAAVGGVHYLDATNELSYRMRMNTYHELARRSKAAVVPASGFEVALADCAAVVAARPLAISASRPLDALDVLYDLHGSGISAGTRRSAIRSLATSWIAYTDGAWRGQLPGSQVRGFTIPQPGGATRQLHAISFPSCETITLPAHLPVRNVGTWMKISPGARLWAPLLVPAFSRMAKGLIGRLVLSMSGAGALKGDRAQRSGDHFTLLVSARRGERTNSLALLGADVYGLTAEIIGYMARAMLQPGYRQAGILAPAQAIDPDELLQTAVNCWQVTRLQGPFAHAA